MALFLLLQCFRGRVRREAGVKVTWQSLNIPFVETSKTSIRCSPPSPNGKRGSVMPV